MVKNAQRGFTIIEVMVVVVVAALIMLSVFIAGSALSVHQKKTQARKDLKTISAAAQLSRTLHRELRLITGNGCSECICRTNGMQDTTCISNWQKASAQISANSFDIEDMTDPWGNPYGLDENEGEMGVADCRIDNIRTAGPDGVLSTSDDISLQIPLLKNPCP